MKNLGLIIDNDVFFDTIQISAITNIPKLKKLTTTQKINLYYEKNTVQISINEASTTKDLQTLLRVFETYTGKKAREIHWKKEKNNLPQNIIRKSDFLSETIFNSYRIETAFMRYINKL